MKNFFASFLMVLPVVMALSLNAQVSIVENFNASSSLPVGWANLTGGGSGSVTTSAPCSGGTGTARSVRKNQYGTSTTNFNWLFASPTGVSNGQDLTINFDYKLLNYSSSTPTVATPNTPNWGTVTVQVSTDGGTTWPITAGAINNTNHIPSTSCASVSYNVSGASLPSGATIRVRWNCNLPASGPDYYVYLDNVSITQPSITPPNCPTTFAPTNAATGVVWPSRQLTWSGATGAPTGYRLTAGSNAPDYNNLQDNVDLGNVSSYTLAGLSAGTTYGWKIVPYNANGDATGCTFNTFTTTSDLLMQNGNVTFCGTNFYDSGGASGAYVANENFTLTVCPSNPTDKVSVNFTSVALETCCDNLGVYNGTGTSSPLNADLIAPASFTSTAADGCLTFRFVSDISSQLAGWAATISCAPPPSCPTPSALAAAAATGTTVDLSWTENGSATAWDVYVATSSTPAPVAGTTPTYNNVGSNNPYTATGLLPATTYFAWVRADCGGSDQSAWVGPVSFSTSLDCGTAIELDCGVGVTTGNLAVSGGAYDITACLFTTPGKEKLYSFTPSTTATYQLQVTSVNSGSGYNDYFIKNASSGCGATGWTCVDDINAPISVSLGTLTGGTTYYILVDAESAAATANHTFQINCPPVNDDCSSAISLTTNTGVSCDVTNPGSSLLATQSQVGCTGNADDDVWFSFVADAATQVVNVTPAAVGGIGNVVFEVFSGSCGSLTSLACVNATTGSLAEETTLNSLTPGNTYYVRVYSNGAAANQGAFTVCVRQINTCLDPSAFSASNITSTSVDLQWTENGTATVWDVFRATAANPVPTSGATPTYNDVTNPFTATGLNAATTYYFWVRSDCGSGTSNWVGPVSATTTIINDNPSSPIALTVGAGCTGAPYTNVGATLGTGEPYPSCSGVAVAPVWFSFQAPSSGAVQVSTDLGSPTFTDSKLAIFDESLNIISCDDDGGSVQGSGFMSVAYAFGLTPGATYLIGVDRYGSTTTAGTFCVAVNALVSSMLTTNDCGGTYQTSVNNSNTTYTGWVPLLDNTSRLVAMVRNPSGGSVGGYSFEATTTTGAIRQASNGIYYLNRNFKINNSGVSNVEVLLPYPTSEMDALTAVDPAATTLSVGVTRVNTTTCDATFAGTPANTTYISQTGNGTANGVDFITFVTPAFSNFYINSTSALPIELKSFTGKALQSTNQLEWVTSTEQNVREHVVERSLDGYSNWTVVGTTPSKGDSRSEQFYSLEDKAPLAKAFYRLRSVDNDGAEQLSGIIRLTRLNNTFGVVAAYPNPATESINIDFNSLEEGTVMANITDLTGRLIQQQQMSVEKGVNTMTLTLLNLGAGTYYISLQNEKEITTPVRFVKQ